MSKEKTPLAPAVVIEPDTLKEALDLLGPTRLLEQIRREERASLSAQHDNKLQESYNAGYQRHERNYNIATRLMWVGIVAIISATGYFGINGIAASLQRNAVTKAAVEARELNACGTPNYLDCSALIEKHRDSEGDLDERGKYLRNLYYSKADKKLPGDKQNPFGPEVNAKFENGKFIIELKPRDTVK